MIVRIVACFAFAAALPHSVPVSASDAVDGGPTNRERAEALAKRVARVLPEGWSARVSKTGEVHVERLDPVGFVAHYPNAPIFKTEAERKADLLRTLEAKRYRIVLRPVAPMSRAEYDRLVKENERRSAERDRLYLTVRDITHKFRSFAPGTPEEKRRIAEYERAVNQLGPLPLPQFFDTDSAIFAYRTWNHHQFLHDEETAAECRGVRTSLERLFGTYDARAARSNVELPPLDDPADDE